MTRPIPIVMQIIAYLAFILAIAWLSTDPVYRPFPPDKAEIKLSVSHAGKRLAECIRLTSKEIAALPPNKRRPFDCPRERLPIHVELQIDGDVVYSATIAPSGLASDGTATVYRRFAVDPGPKQIVARLRDSSRTDGFDYEQSFDVELQPLQNFVIDFKADRGGFLFM